MTPACPRLISMMMDKVISVVRARRINWLLAAIAASLFVILGYSALVYADEYGGTGAASPYTDIDADGDGYGDNVPFTVPTSITFVLKADGTLIGPDNAFIENKGASCLHISSIQVLEDNGFAFVQDVDSVAGQNSVKLEFGTEDNLLDASQFLAKTSLGDSDCWSIGPGEQLPLTFTGQAADLAGAPDSEMQFGTIQWFVESDSVDPRTGGAYAVLDANGKFTLFRSNNSYANNSEQTVADIMGNEYTGRVYAGVENTRPKLTAVPWRLQNSQILSVDIAEGQEIAPTCTFGWFYDCVNMTSCDLTGLDISAVEQMNCMFDGCSSLTSIDVSMFDTSNVLTAASLFYGCKNLTSLDVSNFNTGKMTNINGMFYGCSGLSSLDLSNFDTSHVENFGSLFSKCTNLESINMQSFDTRCATSTNAMFKECKKLISVDFSGCDMSHVTNSFGMFYDCFSLTTIYADPDADWTTYFNEDYAEMFSGCIKLVGGAGTQFVNLPSGNSSRGREYARIDGLNGNPGLFTCTPATQS